VNNTPALFAARLTRAWSTRVKHGWPFLRLDPYASSRETRPPDLPRRARPRGKSRWHFFKGNVTRGVLQQRGCVSLGKDTNLAKGRWMRWRQRSSRRYTRVSLPRSPRPL